MTESNIFQKLAACKTLPTLPFVATEIVRISRDDDLDLDELSRVVANDPVIASKLLSTANSPMFLTRGGAPTTIKQAVMRLGANTVLSLGLSFCLARLRGGSATLDQTKFWKRALTAATAARTIGTAIRCNPEEAFLAGLFQDIGVLAMNEAIGPSYAELLASCGEDHLRLERHEQERFGASHRDAGAWLAETWKLPSFLVHTTRHSHNPDVASAGDAFPLHTRAVALSGYIADVYMADDRAEATRQAAEVARMWLDLSSEKFTMLLGETARFMPALAKLFEVQLDTKALTSALDEANDALVRVTLKSAQNAFAAEDTAAKLTKQKEQAEHQARRDALTGLFNRGHFDAQLQQAYEGARSLSRPLSIVFVDVDHFKGVNDKYGHQAGDAVLQTVGRTISRCMRQLDVPVRYGGEEFAIILPNTDRAGAATAAERLRKLLEKQETTISGGRSIQVTASFGCATFDERFRPEDAATLVSAADEAVYRAKREGRNRVVASS